MVSVIRHLMPQWCFTKQHLRENSLYVGLILVSLVVLAVLTLTPDGTESPGNYIPLVHLERAFECVLGNYCRKPWQAYRFIYVDFLGNVAIFVPLGVGIAGVMAQRGRRAVLVSTFLLGALVSLSIEVGQLFVPSRSPDIDDIIFNSLGSLLGGVLFLAFRRRRGAP